MYVCMYIYCGFVLAVGSASDGSSTKQLKKKNAKTESHQNCYI